MALVHGTSLGPYTSLAPLGAGGMGEVYSALDPKLGRRVAIKVLPSHLAADPAALARFEREAKALAAHSHPCILSIFDFGREGEVVYAVLELLEGRTLRDALKDGPRTPRRAAELGAQVAQGLAAGLGCAALAVAALGFALGAWRTVKLPSFRMLTHEQGTLGEARFLPGSPEYVFDAQWSGGGQVWYAQRLDQPGTRVVPGGEGRFLDLAANGESLGLALFLEQGDSYEDGLIQVVDRQGAIRTLAALHGFQRRTIIRKLSKLYLIEGLS